MFLRTYPFEEGMMPRQQGSHARSVRAQAMLGSIEFVHGFHQTDGLAPDYSYLVLQVQNRAPQWVGMLVLVTHAFDQRVARVSQAFYVEDCVWLLCEPFVPSRIWVHQCVAEGVYVLHRRAFRRISYVPPKVSALPSIFCSLPPAM